MNKMVKHTSRSGNQNNTHTDQPQAGSSDAVAAIAKNEATAEKVVALRPSKGQRANIFEMEAVETSEGVANNLQVKQQARQLLAQAKDLYGEGGAKENEAKEVAAKAAILLSGARFNGSMTSEEVSAALGDIFGYKAKADGTPSKTPDGQGEAIRKRIVRLADANDYVNGARETGFFKDMPADKVRDIIGQFRNNQLGFWASYEAFGALKREMAVPVPLAFNVKRIAEIAETLGKDGAVKAFMANKALRDAYGSLWAIIRVVGEEVAEQMEKAA